MNFFLILEILNHYSNIFVLGRFVGCKRSRTILRLHANEHRDPVRRKLDVVTRFTSGRTNISSASFVFSFSHFKRIRTKVPPISR